MRGLIRPKSNCWAGRDPEGSALYLENKTSGHSRGSCPAGFGTIMKKCGLALSGGGFRATLYHLGLIRFLRDAGLLSQVTHITSVSGGSIMAAHLVLHWNRYTGSEAEFDEAAAELLDFIQLDIRNRILRRF